MRDAATVAERLAGHLAATVTAMVAAAPAPVAPVYVSWGAAAEVATCPPRYRAAGEAGWRFPGWAPATAGAAAGRAALDHHLQATTPPAGPPPLPAPLEAVRSWMRSGTAVGAPGVAGWVAELRVRGDGTTMAATAATAARWLAGFVRLWGWPLPSRLALLNVPREGGAGGAPRWWPARRSPVSVASGADARLGRPGRTGDLSLVVHRPSSGGDRDVHRRAAYEAAAGALALRVAPEAVVVSGGDTGERVRVVVDDDLLAAGAEMIAAVVRARVTALTAGFDPGDARPSVLCRWCEEAGRCPAGAAWLAGPGRWHAGLPVLAAEG
ncbi:MAG TPA: hypothetical protein VFW63_12330 [Acidimicrobiales bacterium]|nr:hypothetical protein [Acidimicrobiales bacterium]